MKLPMARIDVIGLHVDLDATVRTLHQLGCVQLDDLSAERPAGVSPYVPPPERVQQHEQVTFLLTRVNSLLAVLGAEGPVAAAAAVDDIVATAAAATPAVARRISSLTNRRDALHAEQAALPRYEATLRRLSPLVPAEAHDPANMTHVILVNQAHQWLLDQVAADVRAAVAGAGDGQTATILEESVGGDMRAMLLVLPRAAAEALRPVLGRQELAQLQLPDELTGQPPDTAVAALAGRLAAIPAELAEIDAELAALAAEHGPLLRLWRRGLADRAAELDVLPRLGTTRHTFLLRGWLPVRDGPKVTAALATVSPTLHVDIRPPGETEAKQAPVALHNIPPARPFESLVRLLAMPRYRGIDPTSLMALFLPIFFGMILGDVGYGIIILGICLLTLRRLRRPGTARDVVQVVAFGAVWGIIFGFLYGEAFGTLGEAWGMHALWLERAAPEQVTALLLFTVAVGAMHITLGLIIGVWEAWRERSRKHALERGGMLLGLIGLFGLVAVLVDRLPAGLMTPAVALLIVGIVLLSASGGWLGILLGPIEFIGLLGNILSYLRLAAVGLASVYVALVANELAGSVGSLLVGVVIAVLIHALNIALGAFSPTIHSLRLHYVEFFRKFYDGGGEPFRPFGPALVGGSAREGVPERLPHGGNHGS